MESRTEAAGPGRIAVRVRVQPRASRDEVAGWNAKGELKVKVTAPPVDDRANRAVTEVIAAFCGVARRDVVLASGAHSRTKRITLPSACENRLLTLGRI